MSILASVFSFYVILGTVALLVNLKLCFAELLLILCTHGSSPVVSVHTRAAMPCGEQSRLRCELESGEKTIL